MHTPTESYVILVQNYVGFFVRMFRLSQNKFINTNDVRINNKLISIYWLKVR